MSAAPRDHDALREQIALYAIGALPAAERSAVESHLRGCAECAAELATLGPVSGALAQIVPQHDPPAALRARILSSIAASDRASARRPTAAWAPWLAAAAMLAVAAGAGLYAAGLRERVRTLQAQLRVALDRVADGERRVAVALRNAADAEAPLAVLVAPDVRRIDLAGQPVAPRASARAFWSRSRGVVLTATNLPALPPGRTYQLWFVTPQAPISIGLVKPDANGSVRRLVDTRGDFPEPVAVAVTIEPDGGAPAPTGDKYLVGAAQ